jgi:co-chaperonin GroES (HSP10)
MIPRMLHDNIAVKVIREEKTASGLYYGRVASHVDVIRDAQEHIQDDILRAEVLAVGPGRRSKKGVIIPPEVSVGDIVRFDCKLGIPLPGMSEDYLMLKECVMLGVEG